MSGPHNKIIAAAAKAELAPLGFKRHGRSRLWLKDHGFWLNIVGFVPSPWSVSVDLDNAAHWIWVGAGFWSWNYSVRSRPHVEYETEEQFSAALANIAHLAASEAIKIEDKFPSFEAIAEFTIARAEHAEDYLRASWFGFGAGVACGIINKLGDAERFLRGVTDERVTPRANRFLRVLESHPSFIREANEVVAEQRIALKLPPLERGPF